MSIMDSPLVVALMQGANQGQQLRPQQRQGGLDDQTQRSISDLLRNLQNMYMGGGGMGGGPLAGGFQMSPQQAQQTGQGIMGMLGPLASILGGGGGSGGGGMMGGLMSGGMGGAF